MIRFPKSYVSYAVAAVNSSDLDDRLSFEDYIGSCMQRDPTQAIENRRRECPNWPDEWLEGHVRFRWISDHNGWLTRGVARRIVSGDFDELQLFLEMHVRSRFLWYSNYAKNQEEYLEIWPLLVALAINDRITIQRHTEFATFPLVKSRGGEAARLFNAVHLLLREPTSTKIADLDLRTSKSTASWLKGCLEFIEACVRHDPTMAQNAFDAIVDGYRKSSQINLMEKAIAFCAHGLLRVAERVSPDLRVSHPTGTSLPWDAELHAAAANRELLSRDHFPGVPSWLVNSFVDLRPLPWPPHN